MKSLVHAHEKLTTSHSGVRCVPWGRGRLARERDNICGRGRPRSQPMRKESVFHGMPALSEHYRSIQQLLRCNSASDL